MKESFWRVSTLILFTCLIIVVASWATATPGTKDKDDKKKANLPDYASQKKGEVVVEGNKSRYLISVAGSRGTEQEKIILYDSWDLANTKDAWLLSKPHTSTPEWKKMRFEKKK